MVRFTQVAPLFFFVFINSLFVQAQTDSVQFTKIRFGGYGEVLYKYMDYGPDRYSYPDGSQPDGRATIGVPRAVFSFEYKFRKNIELVSELEIEHGGTGSALELEYEEAGEYETEIEKGGEVVLEQLYVQKIFFSGLKLKIGHIVVPVGHLNVHHLPIDYFTTMRPEGESQIIPSTWHETGISLSGDIRKWAYEIQLVSGLDANGFSRANWVRSGYQRLFEETKASQMAGVARIENRSLPNMVVSLSGYIGNSAKNTSKPQKMEGIKGTVSIVGADFEFDNKRIIGRGGILYGNLTDAYEISAVNQTLSNNIQYPRTPVAQNAMLWSLELGYDIFTHFRNTESFLPFVRYEYYNSMQTTTNGILADERFRRNLLVAGINFSLIPELKLKADYVHRLIGNGGYNAENTIGIAVVYTAFFFQK